MPILIKRPPTGGVLHAFVALRQNPGAAIIAFHRESGRRGKSILSANADALVAEIEKIAPGRLRQTVAGVEKGKLSARRELLARAVEYAREQPGAIIVASDLSRFIRSESYDRSKNRDAWPTSSEFAALHLVTWGVKLATVVPPWYSESKRHSMATRRTGRAGRPCSITEELAMKIFYYGLNRIIHKDKRGHRFLGGRISEYVRSYSDAGIKITSDAIHDYMMAKPCPLLPGTKHQRTWFDWLAIRGAEPDRITGVTYIAYVDGVVHNLWDPPPKRPHWRDRPGRPPKWSYC